MEKEASVEEAEDERRCWRLGQADLKKEVWVYQRPRSGSDSYEADALNGAFAASATGN